MPESNTFAPIPDFFQTGSKHPGIIPRLRHLLLAKHHNGHGIHSPYLYHLVTQVIFNEYRYYSFDSIEYLFPAPDKEHEIGQALFRLAEDIKASTLVSCGYAGTVDMAYLMSVKTDAYVLCLPDTEQSKENARIIKSIMGGCHFVNVVATDTDRVKQSFDNLPTIDLGVFDLCADRVCLNNLFETCLERTHAESVFVVKHIHKKGMETWWKSLINHPQVTASLDVYNYGLLFFRPDLEKKHYLIRQ